MKLVVTEILISIYYRLKNRKKGILQIGNIMTNNKKINLWLKRKNQNTIEGRTENYWIKIRRTKGYFDVLIGKKGEKAHIHYGLKPDYTYQFLEDRGKVKRVTQEKIKSEQERELIEKRVFNQKGEPQLIVQFRFNSRLENGNIHTYITGITLSERKYIKK